LSKSLPAYELQLFEMSQRAIKSKTSKSPNPLFEKWISEWLKEATDKGLEVRHGYQRVSCLVFQIYDTEIHIYIYIIISFNVKYILYYIYIYSYHYTS